MCFLPPCANYLSTSAFNYTHMICQLRFVNLLCVNGVILILVLYLKL